MNLGHASLQSESCHNYIQKALSKIHYLHVHARPFILYIYIYTKWSKQVREKLCPFINDQPLSLFSVDDKFSFPNKNCCSSVSKCKNISYSTSNQDYANWNRSRRTRKVVQCILTIITNGQLCLLAWRTLQSNIKMPWVLPSNLLLEMPVSRFIISSYFQKMQILIVPRLRNFLIWSVDITLWSPKRRWLWPNRN